MRPALFLTLALASVAAFAPPALADYLAAAEAILDGRDDGACDEFRAMVDRSPGYDYGHFMLGLCAIHADDPALAISRLRTAVELNDLRFDYRYKLARALTMASRNDEALETLQAAESLVTDETRATFHTSRGFAHATLKQWPEAAADLEIANRLDAGRPALLNQLALCYVGLERYDEALALLDKSLAVDSSVIATNRRLAEVLLRKARRNPVSAAETYALAFDAATRYLALAGDDSTAEDLLARAALGAGRYSVAADTFQRYLARDPSHCPAWVNLALSRIGMERWDDAAQSLETALDCDPDSVESLELLAMVYRLQQRLRESLAAYERAHRIRPSASVEKAIAEVRYNIEALETNALADMEDQRVRDLQDRHDQEQDDLRNKIRQWNKRIERN